MYAPEPLSQFETALLAQIRTKAPTQVFENVNYGPAYGNARAFRLASNGAVLNSEIRGVKYAVSCAAMAACLVKNLRSLGRNSNDMYGAGLLLEATTTTGSTIHMSNVWIDLMEAGPLNDYKRANNECVDVETGHAALNVRKGVFLGAEDAGFDVKSPINLDGCFISSGHRNVRLWNTQAVLANCTILAEPGTKILWANGMSRFSYYNCRFGYRGQSVGELSSILTGGMVETEDGSQLQTTNLGSDPFDRGPASFWQPVSDVVPATFFPAPAFDAKGAAVLRALSDWLKPVQPPA